MNAICQTYSSFPANYTPASDLQSLAAVFSSGKSELNSECVWEIHSKISMPWHERISRSYSSCMTSVANQTFSQRFEQVNFTKPEEPPETDSTIDVIKRLSCHFSYPFLVIHSLVDKLLLQTDSQAAHFRTDRDQKIIHVAADFFVAYSNDTEDVQTFDRLDSKFSNMFNMAVIGKAISQQRYSWAEKLASQLPINLKAPAQLWIANQYGDLGNFEGQERMRKALEGHAEQQLVKPIPK